MHVQHQMIAINMQYTSKKESVHDYPSRVHINNPAKLVTGSHINLISYAHNRYSYLCTYTQLHKFSIISPNRNSSVAIYHNEPSLCHFRVRNPSFSAISMVQHCFLPQFICILTPMHGTVLLWWWCWVHLSHLVWWAMSGSLCYRAAIKDMKKYMGSHSPGPC